VNWERPGYWAKPSGHNYETANLKNTKKPALYFLLKCQNFHAFKLRFIQMTVWHRKPTVESQPQMENIMTVTVKKTFKFEVQFLP